MDISHNRILKGVELNDLHHNQLQHNEQLLFRYQKLIKTQNRQEYKSMPWYVSDTDMWLVNLLMCYSTQHAICHVNSCTSQQTVNIITSTAIDCQSVNT